MTSKIDPFGLPPREAIDWFTAKGNEFSWDWRDVWQSEHSNAFTVAKAMQADLLADIRAAVDEALANGQTLATFKKNLKPLLQEKGWWGKKEEVDPHTGEVKEVQLGSPRRLKVIYDTNLRQAHSAGKWQTIQRTKAARPYLRYVHRFGKTRKKGARAQHQAWHDLVRPVDDPIWDRITPMNGWGCHCTLQQLSERDLKRYGLRVSGEVTLEKTTWTNPRTGQTIAVTRGVDPGFDYNPGKQRFTPPVTPTPEPSSPPKTSDGKKSVRKKTNAKLTPEHWEKNYRAKYSDAARQVGYGRAIHEQAKLIPWSDAHVEAMKLQASGVPGFSPSVVNYLRVASKYGPDKLPRIMAAQAEAARVMLAHARQISEREQIPLQKLQHGPSQERLASAAKWYERFASQDVEVPDVNWEVHHDPNWRAFIYAKERNAHLGVNEESHVWVHEWGHAVEVASPSIVRKVRAFRKAREGDAAPRRLSEVTGNANYEPYEVTREDEYWDPYVGKVYAGDSTEFLSTLCGDVAFGKGGEILSKDPESLYFGLGLLAGY